jgi:hypothetical protein
MIAPMGQLRGFCLQEADAALTDPYRPLACAKLEMASAWANPLLGAVQPAVPR